MKKPIIAMAALLFSSALTATATAQQPGTQQGAPQSQNMPQQQNLPDASEFSDADLDAFVANNEANKININNKQIRTNSDNSESSGSWPSLSFG
jgi:hypothetical protein